MSASTPSQANTVFVVDDDAGMLESTQWLLESVGLQVRAYSDGRQFLNDVGDNRPGCVVLDIRMPGLGGLNVQEELQKRGLEIPIIRSEERRVGKECRSVSSPQDDRKSKGRRLK